MDALVRTLEDWIAIPSVSGEEGEYGDAVARRLAASGLDVERVEVGEGRATLLAAAGDPRVVLCTHLDTVPPFFGPRRDREFVHGRGACDAKGVLVAMLGAVDALLAEGRRDFGLCLTVGEETVADGAQAADAALAAGRFPRWRPRHVVVGEPTGNRFVRGHKGLCEAVLHARGVAGHSSRPQGPSAVHELVRTCGRLIDADWGTHPVLGPGSINLGTIRGGVADNVVAAEAECLLLVRAVDGPDAVTGRLRDALTEHVSLDVLKAYGPVEFHVPDGEESEVVAFGTDAPFLEHFGKRWLVGPGDIEDAHTDHEKLSLCELDRGVERYRRLVMDLLEWAN